MAYDVSESMQRYRAERDAAVRRDVPWWRRRYLRKAFAIADKVYDQNRRRDVERAAARASSSGERGTE